MKKRLAHFARVVLGVGVGLFAGCGGNTTEHAASGDAGAITQSDAAAEASAEAGAVSVPVPRPIAPLSTATATSQRPTFRWELAEGADGASIDVCGDRLCSVVVTSFSAMGSSGRPSAPLNAGVYFWRLHGTRSGTVGANASAPWEIAIGAQDAPVDTSWGSVADFNGDRYADLVVGAYAGNAPGAVGVYAGSASGVPTTPTILLTDPETASQSFGSSVSSGGDVNGDGFADLLVTAYEGGAGGGRVYVYFGDPNGIAAAPSQTISDPAPSSSGPIFGYEAAGVGDVNGDGYGDVLVAATCVPCAQAAYVFLGGASGLDAGPATSAAVARSSDDTGAWFSAASAGDTNGDGYGDIALGSGGGTPFVGAVTVYLGGAQGISSTATDSPICWWEQEMGRARAPVPTSSSAGPRARPICRRRSCMVTSIAARNSATQWRAQAM
jgi:hypothetical protein